MIQDIIKRAEGKQTGPMEEQVFQDLDENGLKTWCFWGRRLLDENSCNVLEGEVPTIEQIKKMPGKIVTMEIDRLTQEPIMIDVPRQYRPSKQRRTANQMLKEEVF